MRRKEKFHKKGAKIVRLGETSPMKKFNRFFLRNSFYLVTLLVLSSCNKLEFEWTESTSLKDTEWVITRYDNTLTNNSEFPMDTLYFIDNNSYQINGGNERAYYLKSVDAGEIDEYHLRLSDCSPFGGDYGTWLDKFSIDEGEVTNKLFNSGDNEIIVWMERI
ncbi:MAG: hypothetical protein HRT58_22630 [Crocinitomicaceae bacterium]|nr:hypothetical protein [Flavobacteriales bacterium]NQZ38475.1 hypothetical protein [Crocinitomicaceae bacterium]